MKPKIRYRTIAALAAGYALCRDQPSQCASGLLLFVVKFQKKKRERTYSFFNTFVFLIAMLVFV